MPTATITIPRDALLQLILATAQLKEAVEAITESIRARGFVDGVVERKRKKPRKRSARNARPRLRSPRRS